VLLAPKKEEKEAFRAFFDCVSGISAYQSSRQAGYTKLPMNLQVEVNQKAITQDPQFNADTTVVMFTPPVGESYWLARVKVSPDQAIVAFPKFGVIGCGFQQETDWNTNLPLDFPAEKIFKHISHNKGADDIPDERCIEAITLLQQFFATLQEPGPPGRME
jgi:hypothetical protein